MRCWAVTDAPVLAALEAKVAELGTARACARYFNISEPQLSQIRNGHRPLPEWMGVGLGFLRVWQKMEVKGE